MTDITVNGNTIDPQEYVSQDAKNHNFIYIQGYHDFDIDQKLRLVEMHVEIQEYVAQHTYLCRYTPEDLETVQSLRFVKSANM